MYFLSLAAGCVCTDSPSLPPTLSCAGPYFLHFLTGPAYASRVSAKRNNLHPVLGCCCTVLCPLFSCLYSVAVLFFHRAWTSLFVRCMKTELDLRASGADKDAWMAEFKDMLSRHVQEAAKDLKKEGEASKGSLLRRPSTRSLEGRKPQEDSGNSEDDASASPARKLQRGCSRMLGEEDSDNDPAACQRSLHCSSCQTLLPAQNQSSLILFQGYRFYQAFLSQA